MDSDLKMTVLAHFGIHLYKFSFRPKICRKAISYRKVVESLRYDYGFYRRFDETNLRALCKLFL